MTPNQSKSFSSTDRTETRGLHAEFEAAMEGEELDFTRYTLPGCENSYSDSHTQIAFYAWRQGRTAINAELLEALQDFDRALSQWTTAYPLSAFPEPNLAEVHAALQSKGMTLDSVSASNMRHVVTILNGEFNEVRTAIKRATA